MVLYSFVCPLSCNSFVLSCLLKLRLAPKTNRSSDLNTVFVCVCCGSSKIYDNFTFFSLFFFSPPSCRATLFILMLSFPYLSPKWWRWRSLSWAPSAGTSLLWTLWWCCGSTSSWTPWAPSLWARSLPRCPSCAAGLTSATRPWSIASCGGISPSRRSTSSRCLRKMLVIGGMGSIGIGCPFGLLPVHIHWRRLYFLEESVELISV